MSYELVQKKRMLLPVEQIFHNTTFGSPLFVTWNRVAKSKFQKPGDSCKKTRVHQETFTEKPVEKPGDFYRDQKTIWRSFFKTEIFVHRSAYLLSAAKLVIAKSFSK